jgi:hypothetical protein
VASGPAAQD